MTTPFRPGALRSVRDGRDLRLRPALETLEERCVLATAANPATVPMTGFIQAWNVRAVDMLTAPRGSPDVVFLGDSITDAFANVSGAPVWNAEVAPLNAVDYAIGGSTTQNTLWQIDHGQLDGIAPKVVVLMIGTNNLGGLGETPEQTAGGVAAVVADIHAHQPQAHVLLLGILPRGADPADPLRGEIVQTNHLISQLANGTSVTYLDIGGVFVQPDGWISPAVMYDYVHPSTQGYELMAGAILPSIQQLLEAPPVAVSPEPASPPPPAAPAKPAAATPSAVFGTIRLAATEPLPAAASELSAPLGEAASPVEAAVDRVFAPSGDYGSKGSGGPSDDDANAGGGVDALVSADGWDEAFDPVPAQTSPQR